MCNRIKTLSLLGYRLIYLLCPRLDQAHVFFDVLISQFTQKQIAYIFYIYIYIVAPVLVHVHEMVLNCIALFTCNGPFLLGRIYFNPSMDN